MWPGKPHIRGVRQAVGAQISSRKLGYCGNFSLAPDQQDDHLIPPHLKILLSGTSPSKETPQKKLAQVLLLFQLPWVLLSEK